MASAVPKFIQQRCAARAAGIDIVRNIFRTQQFPDGVSTKQLYKLAVQEPAPPGFEPYPLPRPPARAVPKTRHGKSKIIVPEARDLYPSHPDHPIRSIRFLKAEILASMKASSEIGTFRQPKAAARLAAEEASATTEKEKKKLAASQMEFVWKPLPPKQAPPPPQKKEVFGVEVGVGADYSHLNKRRQRARVEKISLAVQKMKDIQNGVKVRPLIGRPMYRNNKPTSEAEASTQ
ncbi:hypothetical protein BDN70DRAFT_874741 [Pholiota conissans]|uniref:Uncharacterized protein n=1 Tax=Pholiota conissans TaxID=109636 RepID=A0A9P5Z9K5_9AGAR|nr:hypothetical protein BDN70DRAFT_874741 [Pholiota conissans]